MCRFQTKFLRKLSRVFFEVVLCACWCLTGLAQWPGASKPHCSPPYAAGDPPAALPWARLWVRVVLAWAVTSAMRTWLRSHILRFLSRYENFGIILFCYVKESGRKRLRSCARLGSSYSKIFCRMIVVLSLFSLGFISPFSLFVFLPVCFTLFQDPSYFVLKKTLERLVTPSSDSVSVAVAGSSSGGDGDVDDSKLQMLCWEKLQSIGVKPRHYWWCKAMDWKTKLI